LHIVLANAGKAEVGHRVMFSMLVCQPSLGPIRLHHVWLVDEVSILAVVLQLADGHAPVFLKHQLLATAFERNLLGLRL
jgi:hypothetical protein